MTQSGEHPEKLRVQAIGSFFTALLLVVILAIGVGWACRGWGTFSLGWLNPALGSLLTLGGLALVIWSVSAQVTLGKGTPAPKVPTQRLVIQGPYAFSRNPMTLGALILYLGIGFGMGSGVVILLTLVVVSTLLTFIYFHETRELTERFGEAYLEYQRRTPFLLPCLKRHSG